MLQRWLRPIKDWGALSRLLVVQEQYPELKANANFQQMMQRFKRDRRQDCLPKTIL